MAATGAPPRARALAELRSEDGALVSVVLDLDPRDTPTRSDVGRRRHALVDAARRAREGVERGGRAQFDAAVEALEDVHVTPPEGSRVRGLVLVADGDDVSHTWLSRPVTDRVAVGSRAAVWEVAGHAGRATSAIVLEVSRELGRASRYRDGRVTEIFDVGVHAERRHDQGGWEQADLQRWHDRQARLHLREAAERLERLRTEYGHDAIVVCGPVEATSAMSEELGPWASEHVAAVHTDVRHLQADGIRDLAEATLDELDAGREEELLAALAQQRAVDDSSPDDPEELLGAVSDARVSCLLTAPALDLDVFSCPQCGRLAARFHDCPLDGTPMQKEPSGIDALCAEVLLRDGSVWIVADAEVARALGPAGVAGLTRFSQ
jgi:Bacterial archaeo-eukaryotic release factor family 10